MAQDKAIYQEYLRKCEPLADKKYKKLEAISGKGLYNSNKPSGGGGGPDLSSAAQEASALEQATKAKAALRRDVDDNRKQCDILNDLLSELKGRVDEMEVTQKRMRNMQEEMGEQLKANQQENADARKSLSEYCKVQFASAESARTRLEERVIAKILATENSITIVRREELAIAAKDRKAMRADSEAIKASVDALNGEMVAMETRQNAKFNNFVAQNTYDIGLVRDAIPEEVNQLGSYLDRTKDNIEQQIKDLHANVERMKADFEKGTKEESCRVKGRQEELLETVRNNDEKQSRDLEAKANFVLDRLAEERAKLEVSVRDQRKWAELRLEERKKSVDGLTDDLKQEVQARIQDRDCFLEELARSCMQREKDESSIITAIEGVVKQINHMNQADSH